MHHTFASSGELVKSRFIHAAFNDSSTHIAAADHNGKIFIIDLQAEKYDLSKHITMQVNCLIFIVFLNVIVDTGSCQMWVLQISFPSQYLKNQSS